MKNKKLLFLVIFTFLMHLPLQAYDKKEYSRLLATNICKNCDLHMAPLSKLDLTGADLSGSNLISANLEKATLYQANLEGVSLFGAILIGAMWTDGSICQLGSIGICKKMEE